MNILVWCEHKLSEENGRVRRAYPYGMQAALASVFGTEHKVTTAAQSDPDSGLSDDVLKNTDVLIYWAHCLHDKLPDEAVERISKRVNEGMGVIFLHSSHVSKPFKKIMGTSGSLKWREDNRHERLYTVNPTHPIATGIPERIYLKKDEMYGEYFDIPTPDDIIFLGWYPCGELFRSGFTYHYGKGKVFYLQPGHETFPIYYNETIRKIISNAALWVAGKDIPPETSFVSKDCKYAHPLELKLIKLLRRK